MEDLVWESIWRFKFNCLLIQFSFIPPPPRPCIPSYSVVCEWTAQMIYIYISLCICTLIHTNMMIVCHVMVTVITRLYHFIICVCVFWLQAFSGINCNQVKDLFRHAWICLHIFLSFFFMSEIRLFFFFNFFSVALTQNVILVGLCFGVLSWSKNDECALSPEADTNHVLKRCSREYPF